MNLATNTYRKAAKNNDLERLILDNIDYVGRLLSTMSIAVRSEDDRENLRSAGILGLVEAANSFDPNQKVRFRTFAFPRIRGAIIDQLRKLSPVSQKVMRHVGMLRSAYERLEPPVSPEQLAEETGMDLEQVITGLEAMRFMKTEDWNDFSSIVHGSWRAQSVDPQQLFEDQELKEILMEAIKELPERERLVLTLYYADELNLAEIGAVIDLSESRVSRVLAAAKFRLQEIVRSKTQ